MNRDAPYDWNGPWWMFYPRQVSAVRARKLRKRGETLAYATRSATGKARYWWDSVSQRDVDGAPYCSYGHKNAAQCDCGPIAENE